MQENMVVNLFYGSMIQIHAKEKIEYYKAISEGLEWLKVKPSIVKNTSDDIGNFI